MSSALLMLVQDHSDRPILYFNASAGVPDNIKFNIDASTDPGCNPGTGVCTIQPALDLPTITDPVVIDGYTQPGASANTNPVGAGLNTVLKIILDGSVAGIGLIINSSGCTIQGLQIERCSDRGIEILNASVLKQYRGR